MARMCMSSNSQAGKMRNQTIFRFLLLYNVLETVYRIVQAADGRTHAFVHVDGDLRYLMEGVSVEMQEFIREKDTSAISFSDLNEENLNAYASPIAFHPPMLNFHFHPVGMPHMERVFVQNLSPDTSIHMLSISGNTLHTHCSFFQDKVISPGGNTSFDVVLLAREEGAVEDTLFIHTSLGSFKFQVSAVGIPNPYRLRPFVGVRMPLNSSYSPIIYMHNPHSTTLQLTEMYSSGGDLHLELPDGENETPKSLWEIPPYETKPVIKANFIARIEKNHTAFIRIRTNSSEQDYLLLPVEVDVSSAAGIYSPTEVIDFGVLRSQDEPKIVTLSLLNAGQKHVQIVNVIATPVNEAVDVKFMPVKVAPDTVFSSQVASITFTPSRALHPKQCCGKIVIKSKNNQYKLQIPYQAHLIRGFLDYNKNCTKFYVGLQNSNNSRELNITNSFNVVIIIYSISLPDEAKLHFMGEMIAPVVLKPGQSSTIALLTFKPVVPDLQLISYLRLHTNISHFDIPLLCFTGHLKMFLPLGVNESFIDFGTLGMGDKRTVVFAMVNENPVDVNLKFWGSNTSKTYVELVGVDKGNSSTIVWCHNFSSMARSLVLKPQHYAIFRIGITAPTYEGFFYGQAFVETQYEKIKVPFNLRAAKGALTVDEIFFENSFPGKISTQSLYVHSTFSHSMKITGINTLPEDSRFVFDLVKHGSPMLYPNSRNMVGKIHFDHRKYCKQKCYSGLPTTTSMGHQWLLGMALPQDVAVTDKELFRTLCRRWQSLIDLEERTTNLTLRLDTTEVRGYLLNAHASLQWPRLFSRYRLKFPITQIGNHTVKDFTLENPSSLPLLVQVVLLSLYPNPANIITALKEKYGDDFSSSNIIKDSEVFSLEDLEENNPNPENHIPAYRKSLEEFFGVQSHKKSIAMLLTPGMRVRIQVGFTPNDDTFKSSIILIRCLANGSLQVCFTADMCNQRPHVLNDHFFDGPLVVTLCRFHYMNNLTVMDALLVHGQGGNGQIKFGNISPGTDSVLMFELTEKLLKDCDSTKSPKYTVPNFTVRRAFTARNTGALPIYVKGFDINGKPCQGYGFRILNCQGFELKPNASRKIDIAYTPDFSLMHIQRTLNIRTSKGPKGQLLQFTVVATVPKHLLSFCSQAIPRPYWEQYAYIFFLLLSIIMILTVIVSAYIDSKRILHTTFFPFITIGVHPDKTETENVFDLKTICATSIDTNSYIKHSYQSSEPRKRKENTPEPSTSSPINVSENNSLLHSMKSSGTSLINRKESPNGREFDDHILDNNRHTKKRNSKPKQIHENYSLEPDLVELKKSHPRNSWTRFLKPPFSFHSCSNINNKPSVATQTIPDNDASLKSLKELDIIGDQNINCFLNIENNARCKTKNKNETKFIESRNCVKKLNDILPEEETSSTTTETSTTESDISEKDHSLPDVCVISKPQRIRYVKNKSRDLKIENGPRNLSKSGEVIDGEGFELSTKSKGHKKIKVNSEKVFHGDILRPSTLELPYKPKAVMTEHKLESLNSSFSENSHPSLNASLTSPDDALNEIVERTQNFAIHQGFHNCLWYKSALENNQSSLSHDSTFSNCPSSYSAVLSRDMAKNKDINSISGYSMNGSCFDTFKPLSLSRPKLAQTSYSKNLNKQTGMFSSSIWDDAVQSNSDVQDHLSGSKLKNWMLQSNPEYCSLMQQHVTQNNVSLDDRRLLEMHDRYGWIQEPKIQVPSEDVFGVENHALQTCGTFGDWPGINLPPVGESLWDSNYTPSTGSWTDDTIENEASLNSLDDSCQNGSPNSVWNSNSLASVWKSDESSWSSPCDNCSDTNSNEDITVGSKTAISSKNITAIGEFDPFHTPSALWMSPLKDKENPSGSESTTWSFSLFSDASNVFISNGTNDQIKEDENNESKNSKTAL